MNNLVFQATNKRQDLTYSYKIFYILIFFLVLLVLSFLVLKDFLAFVCIFLAAFALFFILSKPPTPLKIQFNDSGVMIGERVFGWIDIASWTIIKYTDDQCEYIFQTKKIQEPFVGFFMPNNFEVKANLDSVLRQKIPFQENLILDNPIEIFIRWIGLK
jgi:hypothetical protein